MVNARNPVESDPFLLYEKLFGPTFREPGEEGIIDPSLQLSMSNVVCLPEVSRKHVDVGLMPYLSVIYATACSRQQSACASECDPTGRDMRISNKYVRLS